MGNTSNRDQWAARERLLFVERLAWWRGVVNRADVREVFGISAAQASADLQAYQTLNPPALAYNLRSKRYETRPEMVCCLHEPRLEDAVGLFLGGRAPTLAAADGTNPRLDIFIPPVRRADAQVERRIFLALDRTRKLTVKYWSVNSSRAGVREIAPHALAHDGYRWHARAWCFQNGEYRDFVLSRIESAGWPEEIFVAPAPDVDWETLVTLTLRPHSDLDEERRKTIERDYGMVAGTLGITVREAMKDYYLAHLRIPVRDADGNERPPHLELV
jgi:hypothetical protein